MLNLPPDLYRIIIQEVSTVIPEEACGLVVGKDNQASAVLPITNELHSPVKFRMNPLEQLRAFQWIEDQQLDLLAIYHSHPNGPSYPSETDIAEYYYPATTVLICSQSSGVWIIEAYRIENGKFNFLRLESF
jgi:[CysO sulfur-carrier protein]-S-L-cysteine hydrolase